MPDTNILMDWIAVVKHRTPSRSVQWLTYYSCRGIVLPTLAAAAALLTAGSVDAQTTGPALPPPAASHLPSVPVVTPDAARPSPKYSAADIEQAFNFMDANRDGKVSRQEAAGFRNVAKHFDAADTNKDGTLSLTEFGDALNRR